MFWSGYLLLIYVYLFDDYNKYSLYRCKLVNSLWISEYLKFYTEQMNNRQRWHSITVWLPRNHSCGWGSWMEQCGIKLEISPKIQNYWMHDRLREMEHTKWLVHWNITNNH